MLPTLLTPGYRDEDFQRIKDGQLNFLKQDLRNNNEEELGKERLQVGLQERRGNKLARPGRQRTRAGKISRQWNGQQRGQASGALGQPPDEGCGQEGRNVRGPQEVPVAGGRRDAGHGRVVRPGSELPREHVRADQSEARSVPC